MEAITPRFIGCVGIQVHCWIAWRQAHLYGRARARVAVVASLATCWDRHTRVIIVFSPSSNARDGRAIPACTLNPNCMCQVYPVRASIKLRLITCPDVLNPGVVEAPGERYSAKCAVFHIWKNDCNQYCYVV